MLRRMVELSALWSVGNPPHPCSPSVSNAVLQVAALGGVWRGITIKHSAPEGS